MKTLIQKIAILLFTVASTLAMADDLTLMVEQDLAGLGYETGPVDGEETMETIIAISKFQSENQLEVTGEVSMDLARALAAKAANPGAATATASETAAAQDPATLQEAQNACLREKIAAAQASQKKKRGFGRLVSAVARTAGRTGNHDIARSAGDVYSANATADDLAAAAKDLGLTEDEVAACQNPG